MEKKLARKFVLTATLAMVIVLTLVLGALSLYTTNREYYKIDYTLDLLLENDGEDLTAEDDSRKKADNYGPEFRFKQRYFSAVLNSDGEIQSVNTKRIHSVDEEDARTQIADIIKQGKDKGFGQTEEGVIYRYKLKESDDQTIFAAVDVTDNLMTIHTIQWTATAVGLICLLLFILVVHLLSRRVVRPFVRNAEIQKQFITNAGHELKTPLTIIKADTEMIELLHGEDKWTESIHGQVTRLTGLINDLIKLARMEERENVELSPVDISAGTSAVCDNFRTVIEGQGKNLTADITPDLMVMAESKDLHELINILVDNAAKYCDDGGTVRVALSKQSGRSSFGGKTAGHARLTVANDYAEGDGVDYSRFFDRFYRQDQSHNSGASGTSTAGGSSGSTSTGKSSHGIGLSMAQTIVVAFRGKIRAGYADGVITFTVEL